MDMGDKTRLIIGLDLGTTTVKAVSVSETGQLLEAFYQRHHGKPFEIVRQRWPEICRGQFELGLTGTSSGLNGQIDGFNYYDPIQCLITAVLYYDPTVRNIIDIGGHNAMLIKCDENGKFTELTTNSLCAAGTGSFLDEQAHRLGLTDTKTQELVDIGIPPTIATRCAVFAKSDMIHRQQEGYSPLEVWSGMCRGLTQTSLNTLLKGKRLVGNVAFTGGVTLNKEVVRWFRDQIGDTLCLVPQGHLTAALGAALLSLRSRGTPVPVNVIDGLGNMVSSSKKMQVRRPPLLLMKSVYPDFSRYTIELDEFGNEVRVIRDATTADNVFLGIDIGSTSTKLVLIDRAGLPFLDIYRKTGGDPVQAMRNLFHGLRSYLKTCAAHLTFLGCSTTGSGRQLIGKIIGADVIINEITAHLIGALKQDPTVETIFEIGGQDAKFMRVSNQQLRDTVMNYVCAAGTGSFLEEIAHKFDFAVQEMGEVTQGIAPPYTSDRCTVFMEQDIHQLIRNGSTRKEAMAAVLYSVAQNYLGKVVGNRPRSKEKIMFLGATARNKGLVAAFENILNVSIVVPLFCHVMGAWGAALRARELFSEGKYEKTAFRGLDVADLTIQLSSSTCDLCQNHCKITKAHIEGSEEQPSWGYLCGRDPEETFERKNKSYDLFHFRQTLMNRKIPVTAAKPSRGELAYPLFLTSYYYFTLWRTFFNDLRVDLFSLPKTNDLIRQKGIAAAGADFCFPVKVAHGHVQELLQRKKTAIFIPAMISEARNQWTTANAFCPYVSAIPSIVQAQLVKDTAFAATIIKPDIDLRLNTDRIVTSLQASLSPLFDIAKTEIKAAWRHALKEQRAFENMLQQRGQAELQALSVNHQKAIVLLGRPYNIYDLGINLKLPRKIADFGYQLIPFDCMPFQPELLQAEFRNMYWNYGQRILSAALQIASQPNLFPIMFTNFNCGPDSFLLTFLEEIFREKPFLVLELDEHGADTGYGTRIEAFFEMVTDAELAVSTPRQQSSNNRQATSFRNKKIWVPSMHPLAFLAAAAFRSYGYQAEALPSENRTSYDVGRSLCRGGECLPTATTLGTIVQQMRKIAAQNGKTSDQAFFMPTATGPCRFGQYEHLHRLKLDLAGFNDVAILAPSSKNTYQGLEQGLRRRLFQTLLMVDLIYKAVLKRRPYEQTKGSVDTLIAEQLPRLEKSVERWSGQGDVFADIIRKLESIPHFTDPKPLVGVVGEIYVRLNPFCNDNVVEVIEAEGAEAWIAPISEWILYTSYMELWHLKRGRSLNPFSWLSSIKNRFMEHNEHAFDKRIGPFLGDRREPLMHKVLEKGREYIPLSFEGETILTIGRTLCFIEDGASLIVNCAPFSCMPGNITSSILTTIQQKTGVPVISTFYDGEENANETLRIYLKNIQDRARIKN